MLFLPFVFSALNGACSGRSGICISTTTCSNYKGTSYTGKCPNDASNIKCCDNISCTANGKTGKCVFQNECSGITYSGLCPGGSDFKCCVPKYTTDTTSVSNLNGPCSGRKGICISTTTCSNYKGTSYSGFCPNDPSNIKCCDNISCSANGRTGKCVFKKNCSGTTYSGLCPGGSDFKCCIDYIPTDSSIGSSSNKSVKELATTLLKFEEGTHKNGICYAYRDTLGHPTIGYGRLCSNTYVGSDAAARNACQSYVSVCSPEKAEQWLSEDIDSKTSCIQSYSNIKAAYDNASNYRKAVLISMAYQLGCNEFNKFKKSLNYMAIGEWGNAGTEMLDSLWATQTPQRAERQTYVIRSNSCGNFCSYYGW